MFDILFTCFAIFPLLFLQLAGKNQKWRENIMRNNSLRRQERAKRVG